MKKRNFVYIFVVICISVLAGWLTCSSRNPDDNYHTFSSDSINAERQEKDEYFKTAENSPIPSEMRGEFKSLNYFPPNRKFYVSARLSKFSKIDTLKMLTTKKEKFRQMLRYGQFKFKIDGKEYFLTAYVVLPMEHPMTFFIPFLDKTSGDESYSGGRYIDLPEKPGTVIYTLDFNLAYNPYCAYNSRYSCPLVPPENTLPVKILAGEKKYHDEEK